MCDILLIDGNNMLHRNFHIAKIKSKGDQLKGSIVSMFMRSLKKLYRDHNPGSVIVAWDRRINCNNVQALRKMIESSYKGNRSSSDESFDVMYEAVAVIEDCCTKLGFMNIFPRVLEADDIAAYVAHKMGPDNDIVVVSGDNDLLQLVSVNDVRVYNPIKKIEYNRDVFTASYGFDPEHFPLYKSIVGDNSDNLPGIKGIGPKTAIKIIKNQRQLNEEELLVINKNLKLMDLNLINKDNKIIAQERSHYDKQLGEYYDNIPTPDIEEFQVLCESSGIDSYTLKSDVSEWHRLLNVGDVRVSKAIKEAINNFGFLDD